MKAKALSNGSVSYFLPCSRANSLTSCSAHSAPACGKFQRKPLKPVKSLQLWEIIPSFWISLPFNLITHRVSTYSDYVCFGAFQSPLALKITNKRASSGNMNCGEILNSPLVSQSWKETAPSYLVTSPPPHGKQRVLPGSGWYVPRGQTLQGLKPSEE